MANKSALSNGQGDPGVLKTTPFEAAKGLVKKGKK